MSPGGGGGGGYVHGSYTGGGMCIGPTRVYGSYRGGGGACTGPTGVVVRVWVLEGCWCVYGVVVPPPPPNHTQLDHLPVHHLPAPPQHPQLDSVWVSVLYTECRVGVLYIECF